MPRGIPKNGTRAKPSSTATPVNTNGKKASKKNGNGHRVYETGSPDGEGRFILKELVLYKLRTFDAEVRSAANELNLKTAIRDSYIRSIDPSGRLAKLDAELGQIRIQKTEAETEYLKLKAEIEKDLGEDLQNFSLEDKTGMLYHHESAPQPDSPAATTT